MVPVVCAWVELRRWSNISRRRDVGSRIFGSRYRFNDGEFWGKILPVNAKGHTVSWQAAEMKKQWVRDNLASHS
jgi:hypothetical protein